MRIPSGSTDRYAYFVGLGTNGNRATGLSSFTVRRSRNGGASAAMTTPTVNETDVTNMPGLYELLLDEDTTLDAGHDFEEMALHITHAGMISVTRTVELYRPKGTEGQSVTMANSAVDADVERFGGVAGVFDSGLAKVQLGEGSITPDAQSDIGNSVLVDSTIKLVTDASGRVELAASAVQAIWDAATSALTTVGSIGKWILDKLDVSVGTRASHSAADVWAVGTRTLSSGANIALAKGTGVTGFNDLSAAQVNVEADAALVDVGLTTTITGRIDAAVSSRMATFSLPANFAALGINASGHISRVVLTDTITTYTGDTPQTGDSFARIGVNGAGLSAVPWNAAWDAEVQSEVQDAIEANHLDHFIAVADPGGIVANSSFLAKLVSKSVTPAFASYDNTTDSHEAIRDRGDAAWVTATGFSTLDAAGVRSAVGLATASLDSQLAAIAGFIDTEVAAILAAIVTELADVLADTNELQTDWVNGGRLDLLIDAIKAKSDLLPASPAAVGSAMTLTSGERDAVAAALLDLAAAIDGKTLREALRIIGASVAGRVSGAGSGTEVFKGLDELTTRLTVTADEDGNRSDVAYG